MTRGFAPGKIILSGEYAVVFGHPGIAVPSAIGVEAVFDERANKGNVEILIESTHDRRLENYVQQIVVLCERVRRVRGRLSVRSSLPVGKGMGSSTALIVAIVRALLGEHERETALRIEDELNPGHSGLDFATIWDAVPALFRKGKKTERIVLSKDILNSAILIDTGLPNEATPELVAWMKGRESEVTDALKVIGGCTERLASGEPLSAVMRDHHKAQVALGIVPENVQHLIASVEKTGGAAKVIGAGGRSGGAGMVLAVGDTEGVVSLAKQMNFSVLQM